MRLRSRPVEPAAPAAPPPFDVIDAPSAAGHRVLLQLERIGAPLGPVLAFADRLYFFVEAGSTTAFRADLHDLGWSAGDVHDLRVLDAGAAAAVPLPPLGNTRWVRVPERGTRGSTLPSARLLLGSLAYACRRSVVPTQASQRKAA